MCMHLWQPIWPDGATEADKLQPAHKTKPTCTTGGNMMLPKPSNPAGKTQVATCCTGWFRGPAAACLPEAADTAMAKAQLLAMTPEVAIPVISQGGTLLLRVSLSLSRLSSFGCLCHIPCCCRSSAWHERLFLHLRIYCSLQSACLFSVRQMLVDARAWLVQQLGCQDPLSICTKNAVMLHAEGTRADGTLQCARTCCSRQVPATSCDWQANASFWRHDCLCMTL